jgi:hypothetical protein
VSYLYFLCGPGETAIIFVRDALTSAKVKMVKVHATNPFYLWAKPAQEGWQGTAC